jgi:hypothetical protein
VQDPGARGRRRRGSHGDDGADGDEADAVLVSEPGQRRPTAQRRERAREGEEEGVRGRYFTAYRPVDSRSLVGNWTADRFLSVLQKPIGPLS